MTDVAASSNVTALAMSDLNRLVGQSDSLDDLLEKHGIEDVSSAAGQRLLVSFGSEIKDIINSSDLPAYIKQDACNCIDQIVRGAEANLSCSSQCQTDVAASETGVEMEQCGTTAAEAIDAAASGDDITPASELSIEEQQELNEEAVEAGREEPYPAANHPGEAPEAGAPSSADPAGELAASAGALKGDEDEKGSGGSKSGNWLVALAQSMAKIQAKFLDEAMKQSDIMEGEAGNAGEGKSAAFLDAQAKYTANMQLFNIFSQQVSTSIKTIGESLSAIARKQ